MKCLKDCRAKARAEFQTPLQALDKALDLPALEAALADNLAAVRPLGGEYTQEGQHRIDNLTKPLGSLGQLEDMALRLFRLTAARQSSAPRTLNFDAAPRRLNLDPALLFTVAADHGVAAEGVSPVSQAVTRQMLLNFLAGGAGVNALCRNADLDFMAVDAGVLGADFDEHPELIRAKIAQGTANFTHGPAMRREEALRALLLGCELAGRAADQGYLCLAAGEMGIGNTTPSSALYCALLGMEPAASVGPGAGLRPDLLGHKAEVIARALRANAADVASGDALRILTALGGLELAVMTGIMLGAAARQLPMLIDGFIAGASFTVAWKLAPAVRDYCFFAHCSAETAHSRVLDLLGEKPMLDLGLRLGEGSGAALGMCLMRGAVHMFNDMASFASAGVDAV
ncbi:MAG: nicotinate-nucleotide--dimethylbenzimidazole phosphoribosyltransferase [Deltaproteobacteria bacterium]|jgi:nicotinate-nucleotide--dimethylbenzimidazole phosphoribosyltransferase|nr:nicotinate-nucleotide--dimethylbenzimidazole phosphoribosyltransferase [Deltaproteobacteria bacterium]